MVKPRYLIVILGLSTCWLYLLHYFGPNLRDEDGTVTNRLSFPSTVDELKIVASTLQNYSVNHWWYVLVMFSSAYVYKQTFCIPGSLFLNMLAGALYGNIGGLLFACVFTATGASACYTLSKTFAKDLVVSHFPQQIKDFEDKVKQNEKGLFYFMLSLRFFPVTPGWLINIAAPIVGIPIKTFYLSTLIGLGPYNFVGVSAGGILSCLQSVQDVFSWRVLFYMAIIGIFALGPAFVLKYQGKLKENKETNVTTGFKHEKKE